VTSFHFLSFQAVNFARHQLSECKNADIAAQKLVQKAMARGSHDNTTALICVFQSLHK
jgi:serine/threonine protein phosphatase PrpC